MTDLEQRESAKRFAETWKDKGYEKGQSQPFWISLLGDVYGVANPTEYITFEDQVVLDHTSFIDGFIHKTHVLIEQKGIDKDLRKPIKQADGSTLSPFQQAKRYSAELPYSQRPRWIVTCNFKSFLVYDMENPNSEPEEILLKDLPKEYYRLLFLVDEGNEHLKKEMEVSIQAGELVGKLYEGFSKQYNDLQNSDSQKSLNKLCVRLVFCLYAEDAGLFGRKRVFHDYLSRFEVRDIRKALIDLFKILDTKTEDRDPYLDEELNQFPYINGDLFTDENIEIPHFTEEIKELLLSQASENFDWSEISPTIFGAVFESTLNPETRRESGMHYTSIENIHKVINPLFLDELNEEFKNIKKYKNDKTRSDHLKDFQNKLASLTFLDPACGSGNFLTETYISLRKIENELISLLEKGQITFGGEENLNPIKVSIKQFYGIEINDFAVSVAKTALWIAESQMMKRTEEIVHMHLDFLPLKSYVNIVEADALRIDWGNVIPNNRLNYIVGNPPFVGFTYMNSNQKESMQLIFPNIKNLDFVSAWYKKASDFIQNTMIECSFVSTNSITQGETVSRLWNLLSIKINFAHTTFKWNSESNKKANVHCVIIGFATFDRKQKWIYRNGQSLLVSNINAYLCDAPDILIDSRNKPICAVPRMVYGNKPADGGNLIIEEIEYEDFIQKEPQAKKFIKPLLGAVEYLNGKKRYCLWLKGVSPAEIRECPLVLDRIKKCKETRENSIAKEIRKFAETPTLFVQITQPEGKDYIIIPRVSSERRRYVPMGFLNSEIKVTDAVQIIPNASLYEFGILTSNVHMAWMRTICGRLKSDYRYSKDVVYNNFPWPNPTKEQKENIEKTAQAILDARNIYPNDTLADLYDEAVMPPELRKAHQLNDKAVMEAYEFPIKNEFTESMCVAELMKMYQKIVSEGSK